MIFQSEGASHLQGVGQCDYRILNPRVLST